MSGVKKRDIEFRIKEIPEGEDILALLGSEWIREYGYSIDSIPIDKDHYHNLLEIGVCRWGSGIIVLDDREYEYAKGTITVIPRNFLHNTKNKSGEKSSWEYLYIDPYSFLNKCHMEKYKLKISVECINKRPFIKSESEIPLLADAINLVMNHLRMKERNYRSCVMGIMYSIMMGIVSVNQTDASNTIRIVNSEKVKKLEKVLDYIEEHYAENLRVSEIAKYAYISETHLRKLFSDYYQVTPNQYINQVRIKKACELLAATDIGIGEIGYRVGYDNLSTFLKNFSKINGLTPKEWRIQKKSNAKVDNKNEFNISAQRTDN